MKSTRKIVQKAVKQSKKGSRPRIIPLEELPYRSKHWRDIRRAVDEVVAERLAKEGKAP